MSEPEKFIEVVAIQIGTTLYFDKEPLARYIKALERGDAWIKGLKLRFVSRQVFELMEAFDLWRHYNFATRPALFKFTEEEWEKGRKFGVVHG